jgi:ubiquitin C-terminal hydrolase
MNFSKFSDYLQQDDLKFVIKLLDIVNSNLSGNIFRILKENEDLTEFIDYLQHQSVYIG